MISITTGPGTGSVYKRTEENNAQERQFFEINERMQGASIQHEGCLALSLFCGPMWGTVPIRGRAHVEQSVLKPS
jgi:hypothetical protein